MVRTDGDTWVNIRHFFSQSCSLATDGHVLFAVRDLEKSKDFYTRVLGLRLVAKTVNQDDTSVYHLFYADEAGSPGADAMVKPAAKP